MTKEILPPRALMLIRPITLVGANVAGKPNFMTTGSGGPISTDPPLIAMPLRHQRYTLKGVLENRTFSVNIPSIELMKETDYCGLISGSTVDKVSDCNFKIFYGKLTTAPMIEQCPVNLECTLVHIISTISHYIIIGRIDNTYISSEYLKDGSPDVNKLNPLIWSADRVEYVTVGQTLAKSHSIGRQLKNISG